MLDEALNNFNELDVGVNLIKTLDITEGDMLSPVIQAKVSDIAEYLNEHPDPNFVVGLVKHNKSQEMSNLDYLAGYVKLNFLKDKLMKQIAQTEKDIKFYEGIMN
jgi:hypothetical protein